MLDEKYKELAKVSLGETDEIRNESLKNLHEWLSEQESLKNLRKYEILLLAFLRRSKFNFDETCERIKRFFSLTTKYPELYNFNDSKEELKDKIIRMVEAGISYFLIENDDEGRRIIVLNFGRRDPELFDMLDFIQLIAFIHMTSILYNENYQVTGCVMIIDSGTMGFKHIVSPRKLKAMSEAASNCIMRQKMTILANTKAVFLPMVSVWKMFLSEKIKKRFRTAGSGEEFLELLKPESLWPIEYGGALRDENANKEFTIQLFKKHFDDAYDILKIVS